MEKSRHGEHFKHHLLNGFIPLNHKILLIIFHY